jgi:predicted transcriptional regulator
MPFRSTARALVTTALLAALSFSDALAASVGQQLDNPEIRDANDQPAKIPDFGHKVLALFYTDPDVSDMNDPFADKLKAANLDKSVYRGVGIANLKDTWLPNSVIRSIVRRKIEKYDATILTDPNHLLPDAWQLGSCDGSSVVLILDKTGKLRYIKNGAMTPAEMDSTFNLVLQLMKE